MVEKRHYLTYCDQNYLYRALVLLNSIERHESLPWQLIIVALDETTAEVFAATQKSNIRIVELADIEAATPELGPCRENRTPTEYYWTLTPILLNYTFNLDPSIEILTYVDADTAFFSDPQPIFDELKDNSVIIHEHRFQMSMLESSNPYIYGRFNVGIMVFRNDQRAKAVLDWWQERCIEWCYKTVEPERFGDQKYLDCWPERFEGIHILETVAAGTAPWNHENYTFTQDESGGLVIDDQPLIHYHFHGLTIVSPNIFIGFRYNYNISDEVLERVYVPYYVLLQAAFRQIQEIRPDFRSGFSGNLEMRGTNNSLFIRRGSEKDIGDRALFVWNQIGESWYQLLARSNEPCHADGSSFGRVLSKAYDAMAAQTQAPSDEHYSKVLESRVELAQLLCQPVEPLPSWWESESTISLLECLIGQPPIGSIHGQSDAYTRLISTLQTLSNEASDSTEKLNYVAAFLIVRPTHELLQLPKLDELPDTAKHTYLRLLLLNPAFLETDDAPSLHLRYHIRLAKIVAEYAMGPADAEEKIRLLTVYILHSKTLMIFFSDHDLRPFMELRAAIGHCFAELSGWPTEHDFSEVGREKYRIGFFRPSWVKGTEVAATLAHLRGLDRNRFEIIIYTRQSIPERETQQHVEAHCDRFVLLIDAHPIGMAKQIRGDNLDALLFGHNLTAHWNPGTLLALFQLAPVQVALTLCPSTTGFSSNTHFINGTSNEPDGAQAFYSEKLLLTDEPINAYDYTGQAPAELDEHNLYSALQGERSFRFASGANFFKLVPALLEAWTKILMRCPNSTLALYPFNPNWTNDYPVWAFRRYLENFFQQRGIDPSRIEFVGPLEHRTEIPSVLRCCDLYLDSFPYSGAVSMLDPLQAGCPIIVHQANQARGRQSTAMLAEENIGTVHTASVEEYIREAVALHRDPERLNRLKQAVLKNRDRHLEPGTIDIGPVLEQAITETRAEFTSSRASQ